MSGFLSKLATLFNAPKPVAEKPIYTPDPDYTPQLADIPRYPPFDEGLPAVDVDRILQTQATIVANISQINNSPYVVDSLRRYAAFVHLLPATKADHFCGAGGLFRLGIEVGMASMIAAEGQIFAAKESAEARIILEPKWHLAAFLAGLCCEAYRAASSVIVVAADGRQWMPLTGSLTDWVEQMGESRYFLRWLPEANAENARSVSALVVNQIITPEAMAYLTSEDRTILVSLLATISGAAAYEHTNALSRLVEKVRTKVIDRDLRTNPSSFGRPIVGSHIEPHILSAMRSLARDGVWTVNQDKSRLWLAPEGLYIIWMSAYKELLQHLAAHNVSGIPTDHRTLAELLAQAGVVVKDPSGSVMVTIRPPGATSTYPAIKIASPDLILADEIIASVTTVSVLTDAKAVAPVEADAQAKADQKKPSDVVSVDVPPQKHTKKEIANSTDNPPPAAITPSPSRSVNTGSQAWATIVSGLKKQTREALEWVSGALETGSTSIFWREQGLCISVPAIKEAGFQHAQIISDLYASNLLWSQRGESKKVYPMENDAGEKVDCIVILANIARAGFAKGGD